jgi:hypothetical protein
MGMFGVRWSDPDAPVRRDSTLKALQQFEELMHPESVANRDVARSYLGEERFTGLAGGVVQQTLSLGTLSGDVAAGQECERLTIEDLSLSQTGLQPPAFIVLDNGRRTQVVQLAGKLERRRRLIDLPVTRFTRADDFHMGNRLFVVSPWETRLHARISAMSSPFMRGGT